MLSKLSGYILQSIRMFEICPFPRVPESISNSTLNLIEFVYFPVYIFFLQVFIGDEDVLARKLMYIVYKTQLTVQIVDYTSEETV